MAVAAFAQERTLPLSALRSGITFAGPDVRAMQDDELANPGLLWVSRGEQLWNTTAGMAQKSCASCHGSATTSMRGVAARYPAYDKDAGAVLDLEARIDACRTQQQGAPALARESDDLLALATYVAYQSRGMPLAVNVDGPARTAFERGRAFYMQRHGQMNLACTQCHDENWGKKLLVETISQGHPTAFPAYRLEWQGLGSLQRRIRACLFGVRAQMPLPGAPELTDVELYLAWRAQGLPLEAPGVRR
ncbi:MAG: sulfur oxidation c-type cytochrome SoxA [Casimicrobiaceae bacterium]